MYASEERIMQNERAMVIAVLLLIIGIVGAENFFLSDCGVRSSRREPRATIASSRNFRPGNYSIRSQPFTRIPKIMHGTPTVEGQYPWQVSLELLHPSYGFIGHWCGGVLIDRNWVLSAAHCIHNDLFNLPLPALWTVVLGEYDRRFESGFEQRIPVEKIILHDKYHNFKHDLVLLKLTKPATTSPKSRVRKICLPFADFKMNSVVYDPRPEQQSKPIPNENPAYFFDRNLNLETHEKTTVMNNGFLEDQDGSSEQVPFRHDNFLRRFKTTFETNVVDAQSRTARYMVSHLFAGRIMSLRSKRNQTKSSVVDELPAGAARRFLTVGLFGPEVSEKRISTHKRYNHHSTLNSAKVAAHRQHDRADMNSKFGNNRRRNENLSHVPVYYRNEPNYRKEDANVHPSVDPEDSVGERFDAISGTGNPDSSQYVDCLATGWGKSTIDDELTDVLLQTHAPIQSSKKCEEAYGDFIKLHRGHLCAGNLDGAGGTCVGDSGGPLQCRISKRGPWILVGITSFGSGCAFKNYPDVYTKISFYRQWIMNNIQEN